LLADYDENLLNQNLEDLKENEQEERLGLLLSTVREVDETVLKNRFIDIANVVDELFK
jgi:dsDNA-binding SOS-regulon protein